MGLWTEVAARECQCVRLTACVSEVCACRPNVLLLCCARGRGALLVAAGGALRAGGGGGVGCLGAELRRPGPVMRL